MPVQTNVVAVTLTAVHFVGNETLRGLCIVLTEVGLHVSGLMSTSADLVPTLEFHLENRSLKVVQLLLRRVDGSVLRNGFGIWNFYVKYGPSGSGRVEFPVSAVLQDMRSNAASVAVARSYAVRLWVTHGTRSAFMRSGAAGDGIFGVQQLPSDWGTQPSNYSSMTPPVIVGSFGWAPLTVNIYRQ